MSKAQLGSTKISFETASSRPLVVGDKIDIFDHNFYLLFKSAFVLTVLPSSSLTFPTGEMLAGTDDADIGLLRAFVGKLDFKRKDLVSALRIYMSKFLVPGEAQKISRIMGPPDFLLLSSLVLIEMKYFIF